MRIRLCLLVSVLIAVFGLAETFAATVIVDASKVVRKVDRHRLMGSNLAIWYNSASLQNPELLKLFQGFHPGILRIPGGGSSDGYFWNGNGVRNGDAVDKSRYDPRKYSWKIDYSSWQPGFFGFVGFPKDPSRAEAQTWHGNCNVKDMHEFIKKLGCDTMAIVNAGTGTPQVAAEWVRWANKKMGYNVKYWEIGNELEGSWENGHVRPDGRKMDGKIYAEILKSFAIAMKKVDPTIKVGAQIGPNWIKDLMEIAGDQCDFVNDHIYFFSGPAEPQDMFGRINLFRTNVQTLRAAIRKYNPKRADRIEVGISEYNAKLYEDVHTADLFSGVWMTAALAELMYGGQDLATQWDTFTQKQADGGGHGFILENSMTPKAEYWSFWMLDHFFGDKILDPSADDKRLITYASKDDAGNIYVMAVNRSESETVTSSIDLTSAGALSPVGQMARFSQLEYRWGPREFKPLWNPGPTVLTVPVGKNTACTFPPMSASIIKFSPGAAGPATLNILGRPDRAFPVGTKASVEVIALAADGSVAAGTEISVNVDPASVKTSASRVVTGADGRAVIFFTAPNQPGTAEMTLASKSAASKALLTFEKPRLMIVAPDARPVGEAFTVEVIPYFGDKEMKLFESFDYDCALVGAPQAHTGRIRNGSAIFQVTGTKAGPINLTASLPALGVSTASPSAVKIFSEVEKEIVAVKFDEKGDIQYVKGAYDPKPGAAELKAQKSAKKSGKPGKDQPAPRLPNSIDFNIKPNQGVLSVPLNDYKGWAQDFLTFAKLNEIKTVNWPKVVAMTFEIYIPADFDASGSYASLVFSLQSEANYWMPLEAYDLLKLPKGQWVKARLDLKPDFQKAMSKFFQTVVIFNCGGPLKGHFYIDNLGFIEKAAQ